MSTIDGLTNNLIDYAGLFPPAGLEMQTVVNNFAGYKADPNSTMLGRLIIPAARLAEFETAAAELLPTTGRESPWRISALVPAVEQNPGDFQFAISGITQFNKRHSEPSNGLAIVDVVEIKTPTIEHVLRTIEILPEPLIVFMEIPHSTDPAESIAKIAEHGFGGRFFAKIRTGGVTPELIPSTADVARFLYACAEQLVGFKATAGLHHPLRGEFDLTYEIDSPRETMHGFINVFVAACFAFGNSISAEEITAILEYDRTDAFIFSDEQLRWRDYELSSTKIARIRQEFAISFGSCSFVEPLSELKQTGFDIRTINSTIQ